MSDKSIKCILINVDKILISEILEIDAQLGDPNCKLINPYLFLKDKASENFYMEPWPEGTNQRELMIRSEDILTIADPTPEIIQKYLELTA
jgi:hypothetical protein